MAGGKVRFENMARLTLVLAGLFASSARASPREYRIIDLGTLGDHATVAVAVANSGRVAGLAYGGGAFLWSREAGVTEIDAPASGQPYVSAMSETAHVVGFVETGRMHFRGFSWTRQGGAVDVGTLGGPDCTQALAVNDKGQVVGGSCGRAFIWTARDGIQDLGTLGGTMASAAAVNDGGQVVGGSGLADDVTTHAFSWTERRGMVDLGTLGGSNCYATAVSDSGHVVGASTISDVEAHHAFLWTASAGMIDLGPGFAVAVSNSGLVIGDGGQGVAFFWSRSSGRIDLGTLGGPYSTVAALNDHGLVVGDSNVEVNGEFHAFVWSLETGMLDLGSLGGGSSAQSINARGQIVGYSRDADGIAHAVLWDPIPTD